MADTKTAVSRVVDYGSGPRLFASKLIGFQTQGPGSISFTLGVGEYRGARLDEAPASDNYVVAVVGTLTLTASACMELANALSRIAGGLAARTAEAPKAGAN